MNPEFIDALEQLARERNIAKNILIEAIEAALVSAYRRHFGSAQNVRVTVDSKTGDIKVFSQRIVSEELADPHLEVSLEEARQVDPRYGPGDVLEVEVTPKEFGRIAAQTAKQVVVQRLREAERGMIFEEFASREGDIINGQINRLEGRNALIDLGRTEAILMASEQIPGERYKQGDRIRAYILEVKRTTKGPQVFVSRSHPGLVKRLFEQEVPEIHDGVVEIKAVAREAGSRAKVAVSSRDPNVDPVGSCVGPKGMRVQAVVRELKDEKIDIVRWDSDAARCVGNALSPAKVVGVQTDELHKVARVIVPDYQLSLAIGREGQNARLAAKLTGWKIDIKSETQMAELEAERRRLAEEQARLAEAAGIEEVTSDDEVAEASGESSEDLAAAQAVDAAAGATGTAGAPPAEEAPAPRDPDATEGKIAAEAPGVDQPRPISWEDEEEEITAKKKSKKVRAAKKKKGRIRQQAIDEEEYLS
jgi:N utilization substance protein A